MFKAKLIDIKQGAYEVLLNSDDAGDLGAHPLDRVKISSKNGQLMAIVNLTDALLKKGEIGVF
jgi:AMP phosphorylase